jgi:hypothetical protein
MKMSSCRVALERGSIVQHRPQDVDSPASERNQSLSVSRAFAPLVVVEGSGLRWTAQAGKRQLVEDPHEGLVPSPHPAVVTSRLPGSRAAAVAQKVLLFQLENSINAIVYLILGYSLLLHSSHNRRLRVHLLLQARDNEHVCPGTNGFYRCLRYCSSLLGSFHRQVV